MENKQIIEVVYKNIPITYHEDAERWGSEIGEWNYQRKTLKEAKQEVDKFILKERGFIPFEAYKSDGGHWSKVTITSIAEYEDKEETKPKSVWTKDSKGRRSKEKILLWGYGAGETGNPQFFLISKENEATIWEVGQLNKRIDKLREEIKTVSKRMIPLEL